MESNCEDWPHQCEDVRSEGIAASQPETWAIFVAEIQNSRRQLQLCQLARLKHFARVFVAACKTESL